MRYREIVKKVSDRMIDKNPIATDMSIHEFEWNEGVGMCGLARAAKKYGFNEYVDFMKSWVEQNKSEAYKINTVNGTAPMITILDLFADEYMDLIKHIGEYIINDAVRIENGAFEHTVRNPGRKFDEQMWADTLFMSCIFLAKAGKLLNEKKYTDEAAKQLLLHHKYLKCQETGLFYHAYSCITKDNMSAVMWGRANAWIIASTVEMLEILPEDFEGRDEILKSLNEQVAGFEKYQTENGMIRTIINDNTSYEETSATAGMAYGIARGIKDGYIDKKYESVYKKAVDGVISQIDDVGYVHGVSGGTPVMPNADGYKLTKIIPILYGQALTVLMLCEVDD